MKFHNTKNTDEYLKELEQRDSLTEEEKQGKRRYAKKLQKYKKSFKELKENLNRLERHQYNGNEDLDYKGIRKIENLLNKNSKDYYKPIKTNGAFNNNCI